MYYPVGGAWSPIRRLRCSGNPTIPEAACTSSPTGQVQAANLDTSQKTGEAKVEKAFFAAGCFWKTQYVFSKVPGVTRTRVGYSGGSPASPTYEQVCTDKTGHAEVALVEYDPTKTSYQKLLEVFFANHDPTTLNRQGPDFGKQYRSAIF